MDGNGLYMCNLCQKVRIIFPICAWDVDHPHHGIVSFATEDWKSWELDSGNHPLLWPSDSGEREVL